MSRHCQAFCLQQKAEMIFILQQIGGSLVFVTQSSLYAVNYFFSGQHNLYEMSYVFLYLHSIQIIQCMWGYILCLFEFIMVKYEALVKSCHIFI